MEIIPERLSVYTTTQIYVLMFISESNYNTKISKMIGFHNDIFPSVDTKWCNLHETFKHEFSNVFQMFNYSPDKCQTDFYTDIFQLINFHTVMKSYLILCKHSVNML